MASEDESYVFSDDLPKQNPWSDDRLGYKPFCARLSKAIISLRAPNGFVIGIHGEWGSGKSTALNFVRAFLNKHNQENEQEQVTLVDFRPWIVSGHQDLITAFFKVMAESLGTRPSFFKRQWKKLLRGLKIGGNSLVDTVATVAVAAEPTVGAVTAKAAAPIVKSSLGVMVDRFLAEPSLQMAHENLEKELAKSGRRFLVMIDDIDRLRDDEIRSIMQMVKTVGRLPNTTYLLGYDRSIVWQALDGDHRSNGPRFSEKVVQQELELPRPSKDALLAMLDKEIDFLNKEIQESERWAYIVRDGVRRWIRHPRDSIRLAHAVKFSWSALKGEIDPADLLAMEGLRLFDPRLFDWVRWNRDFLFSDGRFSFSTDEEKAIEETRLSDYLSMDAREASLRILTVLFPHHAKAFEGRMAFGEEAYARTVARRGVGYAPGYDAYFGLHPSPDAIPKITLDRVIANLNDAEELREIIAPFITKRDRREQILIGQLLEELRYRFHGRDRLEPTQQLLDVLFGLGDQILCSEWNADLFITSPKTQLTLLISEFLEIWGTSRAGSYLVEAFKKSNSALMCSRIFVDRARELGKIPHEDGYRSTIDEDALQLLGTELLLKINHAVADGSLAGVPFYYDIARAWAYIGDPDEAKAWLSAGMMDSAQFLAKVTTGLVAYTIGSRQRSYSMDKLPDESLYDLQTLQAASEKHLAGNQLDQDQRDRITAVKTAIEKLKNLR